MNDLHNFNSKIMNEQITKHITTHTVFSMESTLVVTPVHWPTFRMWIDVMKPPLSGLKMATENGANSIIIAFTAQLLMQLNITLQTVIKP